MATIPVFPSKSTVQIPQTTVNQIINTVNTTKPNNLYGNNTRLPSKSTVQIPQTTLSQIIYMINNTKLNNVYGKQQ